MLSLWVGNFCFCYCYDRKLVCLVWEPSPLLCDIFRWES